ncbi:hypothetical protein HanIR_Chr15g0759981 [Helianthus annuus]|nr:hypothetical protein HanIR_Chr15g0759981 [Helianthus annuus]
MLPLQVVLKKMVTTQVTATCYSYFGSGQNTAIFGYFYLSQVKDSGRVFYGLKSRNFCSR